MKKVFPFVLLCFIITTQAKSQELFTIGEVFDYEIGDVFHLEHANEGQPPSSTRTTIIDKYYSQDGETLYYKRADNYYQCVFNPSPEPHLDYYFYNDTCLLSYTNLSATIDQYDDGFENDTTIRHYNGLCGMMVNEYDYITSSFEGDHHISTYAKGLGRVYFYLEIGGGPNMTSGVYLKMIYYKKGDVECGTPDITGVNELEQNSNKIFTVSPNPASSFIRIEAPTADIQYHIQLRSVTGQKILEQTSDNQIFSWNTSDIEHGLYILVIRYENHKECHKIIIQ